MCGICGGFIWDPFLDSIGENEESLRRNSVFVGRGAFETLWALSCITKDSNGGRRRMIWVVTQICRSVRFFSVFSFVFAPSSTYTSYSRCYIGEHRNWLRLIADVEYDDPLG